MSDYTYQYVIGEISPKKYLKHVLEDHYWTSNKSKLQKWLIEVISKGFWELDSLCRSDPFWENSNNLTTLFKLQEFARLNFSNNHESKDNAWLLIALNFLQGSGHLKLEWWSILHTENALDYEILVESAWLTSGLWQDENIDSLYKIVTELNIHSRVEPFLLQLANRGDDESEWVNKLKNVIRPAG